MKIFLSLALLGWFLIVLFFVNRAQASYCQLEQEIVNPSSVNNGIPIISFDQYSRTPDTSSVFHLLRDSIRRSIDTSEKLVITAHYTQIEFESDKNIGLKRANSIRSLFEGYIDLDEIEINGQLSEQVSAPEFEIQSAAALTQAPIDTPAVPEIEKATLPVTDEEKEIVEAPEKIKDTGADYTIYFRDESSSIIGAQDVQQYIDALSKRIKKSKEKIEVIGYDDNGRSNSESLALAKRRTWKVRKAFSDNFVRRKLVIMKNIGQDNPTSSNETPEGRSKNRRVEIRILKK